ncbi:hypothetical protein HAHI6034_01505 [Hathewaya histolytica]|uniref:Uncharacterized protein n=1 Tax=Hathewaya histolytica TaxID=1498 RepID=A0A4U9QZD5_HATHI|nr:hypothetical protein [Hathewaya histolytica]VTQ83999.1 Uncharacterised protein [Hathewaya histolytica]
MEKIVLRLIFLNIVYYLNNFLYVFIDKQFGIDGFLVFWAFSPYILIILSGLLLENLHLKTLKKVRKIVVIDLVLRVVSVFINYYSTSFKFKNINFISLILVEIIIMLINIFLEFKIYRHVKYSSKNEEEEYTPLSNEESKDIIQKYYIDDNFDYSNSNIEDRKEIDKLFRLIKLVGYSTVMVYSFPIIISLGLRILGERYRLAVLFIVVIIFFINLYLNYIKLTLYYIDEKMCKKIYIRDNVSVIIGILILFIYDGIININTGGYNIFIYIISCVFFAVPILTNKKISIKFHKINKDIIKNKKN